MNQPAYLFHRGDALAAYESWPTPVVIVSDGAGSHPNSKAYPPDRLRLLREEEARRAGAELGLRPEEMLFLGLPDRFVPHEGEEAERAMREHPNSLDKRDLLFAALSTRLSALSKAHSLEQIALIERALALDPNYFEALERQEAFSIA